MIKSIGIIGQGFVGSAVREKMIKHFDVYCYDKDPSKGSNVVSIKELVRLSKLIFVCLPTPMKKTGECDISIVESVLSELNDIGGIDVILKSTVPTGTTDRLNENYQNINIAFNPEFLTEANAVNDYENQNRIVLGAVRNKGLLLEVFSTAFPSADIIFTHPKIAEMVKYVTNCFLATKVSFANEIYQMCEALKINYQSTIDIALYDERLGKSHWKVPGLDGDFGFGGHCFPKDLSSLKYEADKLGVTTTILTAVKEKNNEVRTDRDWEKQIGRAVSE